METPETANSSSGWGGNPERSPVGYPLSLNDRPLRVLFAGAINAMVVIDDQGRVVDANPAACELFGLTREALSGRQTIDFIQSDFDLSQTECLLQEEPFRGVCNLVRSNGSRVRSDYTVTANFLPHQHLVILHNSTEQGAMADISPASSTDLNLHQAELALRQSEATKRAMIEALPDLLIHMHRDGTYVEVQESTGVRIFNPARFVVGNNVFNVLPPATAEERMDYVHRALDTGKLQIYEYSLDFNNEVRHEEARVIPINSDEVLVIVRDITERKLAEAALIESEARFRTLADSAPVMIWMSDTDGTCNFFNQPWLEFTGRSLEELVGTDRWLEDLHPDDRENCRDTYLSAFAARQKFRMEYRLRRVDGEFAWVLDTGTPRLDSQNNFLGYIGSCIDISDRKLIEDSLRESEARLRLALEVTHMGNWDWNILTNQVVWSENLERLMGVEPGSFDGRFETLAAMIYPDDRERVLQAINRSVERDVEYDIEFRFVKPDGSLHWAAGKGKVLRDSAGQPIRMTGIDLDITDRKLAEAALQASEARFRAIFEHAGIGIAVSSPPEYKLTLCNPFFLELVGYSLEELNGFDFIEYTHPDDVPQEELLIQECLAGLRDGYQVEKRYIRKDRSIRWVSLVASIIRDAEGQIQYGFVMVQDITNQKAAEAELQRSEAKLQDIFNSAIAGIVNARVYRDRTWEYDYLSAGCEQLFGFTVAELMAHPMEWSCGVHPDDLETLIVPSIDAIFAAQSTQFEYRYSHRREGSLRWIRVHITSRFDPQGDYWMVTMVHIDITDRKEAERKQAQLAAVLESTPDYVAIANAEGYMTYLNQAGRDILGLGADEDITALYYLQTLPPRMRERVQNQEVPKLLSQGCWVGESVLLDRNGQEIPVSQVILAHHSSTGEVEFFSAVARDIRDLKRIEAEINTLNQRLQDLILAIQRLAAARDLDTIMAAVRTAARRLTNADGATFVLREGDECYYADEDTIAPLWKGQRFPIALCASGWAMSHRVPVVIPDVYADSHIPLDVYQSTFVKSLVMVPIRTQDPLGAIGNYWATSHVPTGDEMNLLQTLAEAAAIAIENVHLYEDLEHRVQERTLQLQQSLDFEALLKRITDKVRDSLDEQQILQTAVEELAVGLNVECCDAGIYSQDRSISTIACEYTKTLAMAQGTSFEIASSPHPEVYTYLLAGTICQFCDIAPKPVRPEQRGMVILSCPIFDDQEVLGDLWLFRQSQDWFSDQEVRLVQQVANQCAIALRQSRLYQTAQTQVQELERLNQLKDDFLSTVSHELRSPMANIKMAVQMLQIMFDQATVPEKLLADRAIVLQEGTYSRILQYFQILDKECRREISLINDLLDLTRLDAGAVPFSLTLANLLIWLPHIAEPFLERVRQQQQQLQIHLPDTLPPLLTDLPSLERIVSELLHNACKYTPVGETITLAARVVPCPPEMSDSGIEITISNSGIELPASECDRIFDRFYRIPNNDPWKHGGTGLGLALVKKLVERLRGTIVAQGANGETRFTILLPFLPNQE